MNSSTLNTSQITAALSVAVSQAGQATGGAVLQDGSSDVSLSSGDALTLAVSGVSGTTSLVESQSLLGQASYSGTMDTGSLGPFTIAFTRTGKTSAPKSTVTLPPAFVILPLGSSYSVSTNAITLEWSTPAVENETMNWSAQGDCINTVQNAAMSVTAGQTSFTIPAGSLVIATTTTTNSNGTTTTSSSTCQVSLTLEGQTTGTVDPAFASGSTILGVQAQTTAIVVTP